MGLLGSIAKKAAGTAAVAVALQHAKRSEQELSAGQTMPYRLLLHDNSTSARKIDITAKDREGSVLYRASGGGLFSNKRSATLHWASGDPLGSVTSDCNQPDWYVMQLESRVRMEVGPVMREFMLFDVATKGLEIRPFGWELKWAKPGVFKNCWSVLIDGTPAINLASSLDKDFVETKTDAHLEIAFALAVCLFYLETPSDWRSPHGRTE